MPGAVVVLPVLPAAVLLAALTACARGVEVEPAPSASEPVCAELLLALPDELAGHDRRSTTSQASRAWGDPAVVLRCGVDPLPPTTDGCLGVEVDDGATVDWVVVEDADATRFTTYGRLPAVEVVVPSVYAGDQGVLTELSAVVATVPRDGDRACL